MPSVRLFSPVEVSPNRPLTLDGERAHYVGRVLRLKVGAKVVVFDGHGGEYAATVRRISKNGLELAVGEHDPREAEPPLKIHLVQAVSRGDRMDVAIQKTTELGVTRITPVLSERSVVRLSADRAARRLEHWISIARNACEQCGRNRLPRIDPPCTLAEWLGQNADGDDNGIVLHPEGGTPLTELGAADAVLTLLIGPEGGFSDGELELATGAGYRPAAMGPRTLRTETAAIAAIAILQSHFGDI